MKKKIFFLVLILTASYFQAQVSLDSIPYFVDSNIVNLKIDKLYNKWFIYKHSLIRYSAEAAYNDTLGNLNADELCIDLDIPLKNLLFYKNKNSIEIRNSRWGIISKFKLDAWHIFQPMFAKFTSDKMIWILDLGDNLLYKFNENGVKMSQKTNPFKVKNQFYFPTEIVQLKNFTIGLDKKFGLFVLDDYGNLIQAQKIDSCQNIFEHKGQLYIQKRRELTQLHVNKLGEIDLEKRKTLLPPYPLISLQTMREQTILLLENKRIYELNDFESLFK